MNKRKLMIGAYYLAPYASTPEHVRDLAQCGIDVVMNMRNDRAALDLLAEHSSLLHSINGCVHSEVGTLVCRAYHRPEVLRHLVI